MSLQMILKNNLLILLLTCTSLCSTAQFKKFNYSRELQNLEPQWNVLLLPNDVYAHTANNLEDIRVYGIKKNKDTIEAPYILKGFSYNNSSKAIPFTVINSAFTKNGRYYSFKPQYNPPINEIKLQFNKTNYDAKVTLQGSDDNLQWFTIIDSARLVAIKNSYTNFEYSTLHFPTAQYRWYRIFIHQAGDLQVESASLSGTETDSILSVRINKLSGNVSVDKENKESIYSLSLPGTMPLHALRIYVHDQTDYHRPITIEQVVDSVLIQNNVVYQYSSVTTGIVRSGNENIFKFTPVLGMSFRVRFYNADNEPLIIDSVVAFAAQVKLLIRITEAADYYLVYGNKNLGIPEYDLSKFPVPSEAGLHSVSASTEKTTVQQKLSKSFLSKYWLWAVLIGVGLILGLSTLYMLKQKTEV